MERLFILGNSGKLEAILDLPEGVNQCVVLCYPHPLYGGNMNDIEGANHFFAEADSEINNLMTEFIGGT